MTDNSMDLSLARFGRRRVFAREEDRHKPLRTACVWLVVLFIHLAFVAILVASGKLSPVKRIAQQEVYLLLPQLSSAPVPPLPATKPTGPRPAPAVQPAPITLPPMVPIPLPPSSADVWRAIGEALACGASSYEYLSEYARENCPFIPWIPVRLPNGTIVLGQPPPPPTGPLDTMTGAEAMRHEMQTAPACPMLANVPCLGNVISGAGGR